MPLLREKKRNVVLHNIHYHVGLVYQRDGLYGSASAYDVRRAFRTHKIHYIVYILVYSISVRVRSLLFSPKTIFFKRHIKIQRRSRETDVFFPEKIKKNEIIVQKAREKGTIFLRERRNTINGGFKKKKKKKKDPSMYICVVCMATRFCVWIEKHIVVGSSKIHLSIYPY